MVASVQVGAIVLSLIVAAIAVWVNIVLARRRATLDLLLMETSNTHWLDVRNKFIELKKDPPLSQWAHPNKRLSAQFGVIRAYLNRYEIISIGIQEGTISTRIYRRWWRSALVEDWIKVKDLVAQIRKEAGHQKVFIEFEKLAKQWANPSELQQL